MEKKEKKKINLIDLLALLAVIGVVIAIAVNVILPIFSKDQPEEAAEEKLDAWAPLGCDVVYTVLVENVDEELYQSIKGYIQQAQSEGKKGDRMMAEGILLENAYVTGILPRERERSFRLTGNNTNLSLQPEPGNRVDVVFTCRAYAQNVTVTGVGPQEVRVGREHYVKTTHFELVGKVISCSWDEGTTADGPRPTPKPESTKEPEKAKS